VFVSRCQVYFQNRLLSPLPTDFTRHYDFRNTIGAVSEHAALY
jgi:hypothetical protein